MIVVSFVTPKAEKFILRLCMCASDLAVWISGEISVPLNLEHHLKMVFSVNTFRKAHEKRPSLERAVTWQQRSGRGGWRTGKLSL